MLIDAPVIGTDSSKVVSAGHVAAVAFCADKFMEKALHVAVFSLLRHLSVDYIAHIYLLVGGFSASDIDCLRRTLDRAEHPYELTILSEDACEVFAEFPTLHGSSSTYFRLLLPQMVDEERLLYLDADVLVNSDVSPLFEEDMSGKAVGFAVSGKVATALDRDFQVSIGRSPEAPAMNAGVCIFNLAEWKRQDCWQRILRFGQEHRTELTSHDQSIVCALFADDCHRLDPRYNIACYPADGPREMRGAGILHFVGAPKPWDLGARHLMPNAEEWFRVLGQTAVGTEKRTIWFDSRSWVRLPRILGGYRQLFHKKLRNAGRKLRGHSRSGRARFRS